MGIFAFLFLTDETIDDRLLVADLKTAQNNHENFLYNPHPHPQITIFLYIVNLYYKIKNTNLHPSVGTATV